MAVPPTSPNSSDITGVDRDGGKTIARGKPAKPDQQQTLTTVHEQDHARPPCDAEIAPDGNAQ